jgi:hypothetical protein
LLWLFLVAAGVGFAIGLRFRVATLFVFAAVLATAVLAVGVLSDWPLLHTIEVGFGALAVQQLLYLIGLYASRRTRR